MIIYNGNRLAVKIVSGGLSGTPITVSTAEEMTNILTNATSADVGKIYKYVGTTTSDYKQGSYYVIKEEA